MKILKRLFLQKTEKIRLMLFIALMEMAKWCLSLVLMKRKDGRTDRQIYIRTVADNDDDDDDCSVSCMGSLAKQQPCLNMLIWQQTFFAKQTKKTLWSKKRQQRVRDSMGNKIVLHIYRRFNNITTYKHILSSTSRGGRS